MVFALAGDSTMTNVFPMSLSVSSPNGLLGGKKVAYISRQLPAVKKKCKVLLVDGVTQGRQHGVNLIDLGLFPTLSPVDAAAVLIGAGGQDSIGQIQ